MQFTHENDVWTFTVMHEDDMYRGTFKTDQLAAGRLRDFITLCPESIQKAVNSGSYAADLNKLSIFIEYINEGFIVDLTLVEDADPIKQLEQRVAALEQKSKYYPEIKITARQLETFIMGFMLESVEYKTYKAARGGEHQINKLTGKPFAGLLLAIADQEVRIPNIVDQYLFRVRGLSGQLWLKDPRNNINSHCMCMFTKGEDFKCAGILGPGKITMMVYPHLIKPEHDVLSYDTTTSQLVVRYPLGRIPTQKCRELGLD